MIQTFIQFSFPNISRVPFHLLWNTLVLGSTNLSVYQVSTYPKGNNVYSNASVLRSQQALTCAGIVQFQSVLPAAVVYAYNHLSAIG